MLELLNSWWIKWGDIISSKLTRVFKSSIPSPVSFHFCEDGAHTHIYSSEEITGIDIVAAQIQIAAGATLPQLGLTQDAITKRGFAIQCRITTEDASQNFQPDTGKIEVYRSAGGNGVRLDASSGFAGAQITVGSVNLKGCWILTFAFSLIMTACW
jgi:hypothetical protein